MLVQTTIFLMFRSLFQKIFFLTFHMEFKLSFLYYFCSIVGNACYYSVQNLLSSSLLSKTLKIKIYRTIILPVALYGCETWSLTLREERRRRVFENRVLRRVFGPKRDEVTGNGENYIMRSLGIFIPYPILCGW